MSKGTKLIRLGRVKKLYDTILAEREKAYIYLQNQLPTDHANINKIRSSILALDYVLEEFKKAFPEL